MSNDETFAAAYREHYWAVSRYVARRLDGRNSDVEEVVAEVFTVAWRRRSDLPPSPLPWLYGVARNCLANAVRGYGRRRRLVDRIGHHETAHGGQIVPSPDLERPGDWVHEALDRLSPADQEILRLTAWEELGIDEIAIALGCGHRAASMRLHRARRRLRAEVDRMRISVGAVGAESAVGVDRGSDGDVGDGGGGVDRGGGDGRSDGPDQDGGDDRSGWLDRGGGGGRSDGPDRGGGDDRNGRPDRGGRDAPHDRGRGDDRDDRGRGNRRNDRPDRGFRDDRSDRPVQDGGDGRSDRPDRGGQDDWSGWQDRGDGIDGIDRPDRGGRDDPQDRGRGNDKGDPHGPGRGDDRDGRPGRGRGNGTKEHRHG